MKMINRILIMITIISLLVGLLPTGALSAVIGNPLPGNQIGISDYFDLPDASYPFYTGSISTENFSAGQTFESAGIVFNHSGSNNVLSNVMTEVGNNTFYITDSMVAKPVSDVNVSLLSMETFGSISGFVYQTNGSTPLVGANVGLFEYSSSIGKWVGAGGTNTGSDGGYIIFGVPTGAYRVLATAQGYANQWYGGVFDLRNAAAVSVVAPNNVPNINFTLQPGGSISGTISSQSSGLSLENISVDLWHHDDSGAGGALTDANGNFTFYGLPYGQYKIGSPSGGRWGSADNGYIIKIYNNNTSLNSGDPVTVSAQTPKVTGINFNLSLGGYISGHVYQTDGVTPVISADVGLFDYSSLTGKWAGLGGTKTGSDGGYYISGIPTGVYGVRTTAQGYANQWYGGVYDSRDALAVFVVAPNNTSNIDFILQPGGSISGTVSSQATGLPLSNISIDLWHPDGSGAGGALTNANGNFTYLGLPYGQYKIGSPSGGRWGSGDDGYIIKIYNNKSSLNNADLVNVSAQTPNVTGINFSLLQGGYISGHVYQTNGASPLIGANVGLFDYSSLTGKWIGVGGVNTGSDGGYIISGVPSGVYGVLATAQGYANQWYGGVFDSRNAAAVSVIASNITSNINFTLQPGGSISGGVSSQATGLPLPNISVDLWHQDGSGAGGVLTDGNGNYTFNGLPYAQYKVRSPSGGRWGSGDDGYIIRYYNNKTALNNADLITVSAQIPNVTGINFSPGIGGTISGLVTDNSGLPIANLHLYATEYTSNEWTSGTYTNSDGIYHIYGLPSGTYRVKAWPPNNGRPYVDEFYNNTHNYSEATPVAVNAPGDTPNINFVLESAGFISGTVMASGLPLSNIQVNATIASSGQFIAGLRTGNNGSYTLHLPAGSYLVQARPSDTQQAYANEYYSNAYFSSQATPVSVTLGNTAGNINFTLEMGGNISGRVFEANGATLIQGASVVLNDFVTRQYFSGTSTGSDGSYTLSSVPNGQYNVVAWAPGHVRKWYPNTSQPPLSQPVVITETSKNHAGIDFTLEPGGTISGSVISGTVYPANVSVRAQGINGTVGGGIGITSTNGTYTLTGLPFGTYIVSSPSGSGIGSADSGYIQNYYNNKSQNNADPVSISANATDATGVDFSLIEALPGTISGVVYDRVAGVPISGATVFIRTFNYPVQQIAALTTGPDGSYQASGLSPGDYWVIAVASGRAARMWNDALYRSKATPVTISSSRGAASINFRLEAGGTISGKVVSQPSNNPLSNVSVKIIPVIDSANSWITITNNDGEYRINVPNGSYKVCAPSGFIGPGGPMGSNDAGYGQKFYDNKSDYLYADSVSVNDASGAAGINFSLGSKYGGILRIVKNTFPTVLGYQPEMVGRADTDTQALWAEPLAALDENSQLAPVLAASWEFNAINKNLTVHLKQGVKFHDGTDFNAQAARWNIMKMLDAHKIPNWQSITSVDILDNYTLRYNFLDSPYTLLDSCLTSIYMYSPTAFETNGIEWARQHPVSTGPFKLVSYNTGVSFILTKNNQYWQSGYPFLDGIQLLYVPDPLTEKLMMQTNLADVWSAISIPSLALPLEAEGYKVNFSRPNAGLYLYPDTQPNSLFNDIRVRQAMAFALDNTTIAQVMGQGKYEALKQLVISDCAGYNAGYNPYPYNPQLAKQLLAEAGYPNGFKTNLTVNTSEVDTAMVIKQYMAAVGIDCEIVSNEIAAYYAKFLSSGWDGLLLGPNPISLNKQTVGDFAQSLGPNRTYPIAMLRSWPQPVLDLMNQGLYIYDDAARAQIARQMIRLASDQLNLIPLYGRSLSDVQQIWVHDWTSPRSGVGNLWIHKVWLEAGNIIINDAPLYLDPATVSSIVVGQTFNIDIKTSVNISQPVDGVDAYITFDPGMLEVVDADAVQAGIQITPGSRLSTVLINVVDNTSGLISYCAGELNSPFPTGNFTVATIQFRAKAVTSPATSVNVSISGQYSTSLVDFAGTTVEGAHGDTTVQIIPGANVNYSVILQGGSRADSGWMVPLTVKFFTHGTTTPVDVLSATPLFSYNLTATKSGSTAIAQTAGINPGTYDISVVSPHNLVNVKRGVIITAPSTDVNLGILLEGNANDDNKINIQDFGILAATYGKSLGNAGFDARADFDRNNKINIADFGLLAANYGKYSPVEAP